MKQDRQTEKKTKEKKTKGKKRQKDNRGRTFSSLYNIIKTKWVLTFYWGKINALAT